MDFALSLERFEEAELAELDHEVSTYISMQVPDFNVIEDRLDTDFYVKVWDEMEKTLLKEPLQFKRLTKIVLGLLHGQAQVERSFR